MRWAVDFSPVKISTLHTMWGNKHHSEYSIGGESIWIVFGSKGTLLRDQSELRHSGRDMMTRLVYLPQQEVIEVLKRQCGFNHCIVLRVLQEIREVLTKSRYLGNALRGLTEYLYISR